MASLAFELVRCMLSRWLSRRSIVQIGTRIGRDSDTIHRLASLAEFANKELTIQYSKHSRDDLRRDGVDKSKGDKCQSRYR